MPWLASAKASCAEKVLLPTPPFPDSTRILCLTFAIRAEIAAMSASTSGTGRGFISSPETAPAALRLTAHANHAPGSGPLGAVAHACWFGQPSHAEDFPACSLLVPGQSAGAGECHKCLQSARSPQWLRYTLTELSQGRRLHTAYTYVRWHCQGHQLGAPLALQGMPSPAKSQRGCTDGVWTQKKTVCCHKARYTTRCT